MRLKTTPNLDDTTGADVDEFLHPPWCRRRSPLHAFLHSLHRLLSMEVIGNFLILADVIFDLGWYKYLGKAAEINKGRCKEAVILCPFMDKA